MRNNSEIPDFVFLLHIQMGFSFSELAKIIQMVYDVKIMETTEHIIKYATKMGESIVTIDNRNK